MHVSTTLTSNWVDQRNHPLEKRLGTRVSRPHKHQEVR
jgi:hypothetical protein